MVKRPRFLYFLPLWAFLFGFLSVNLSRKRELKAMEKNAGSNLNTLIARVAALEAAQGGPAGEVLRTPARLIF